MSETVRRFYVITAVGFAWFAIALQFHLSMEQSHAKGMNDFEAIVRFASFFTVLTNILVASLLTLSLARRQSPAAPKLAAGTAFIVIVGIVYFLLLRKTWNPQGPQLFADIALHYVMPAVMLGYWLIFVPKGETRWSHALSWLLYPATYLAFTLLEGPRVNWYPYPFVDVNALGYTRVLINSIALFAFFACVNLLVIGLDRALGRRADLQAV